MKLTLPQLNTPISIHENVLTTLVVENGALFRNIIESLYFAQEENNDSVILSENNKDLPSGKYLNIISQFIPFTLNTKSLLTAATKKLTQYASSSNFSLETERITLQTNQYLRKLLLVLPFEMDYNNISAEAIIKAGSISFSEEHLSPTDKILQYLRMQRELIGDKLNIFINIRSYFTQEEIETLWSIIKLEKYKILLIDSSSNKLLTNEARTLIDSDLCEIKEDISLP